jgi:hypothetical protein
MEITPIGTMPMAMVPIGATPMAMRFDVLPQSPSPFIESMSVL